MNNQISARAYFHPSAFRLHPFILPPSSLAFWRRGWDSNPRNGFPFTAFPVLPIQPLLHLSRELADLCLPRCRLKDQLAMAVKAFDRQFAIPTVTGGEGGIRTHGGLSPTPVFETGALIHYATSPRIKRRPGEGG